MDVRKGSSKDTSRRPGWVRGVEVLTRTGHVGVTGILFGGAVYSIPFHRLVAWHHLSIATGAVLIVLRICQTRHWFHQMQGVMAMTHVALLGLVHPYPEYTAQILTTVLVLGVTGSHMPGNIRHWSLIHRRRID